ncbi:MAG: Stk1 family PASTA domain-containing Ser/Thr kinase [Oscillospiraceae bacterium]|nr:Stk1 family PASTA domain-containing Ser/Thr kinase [Oscillospiraceae bacterium]
MQDYTNKRIDGRYEIQELIGVGGMACVYRAYDNIDDRIVAVKILKDEFLTNEDFRARFKNESKMIAMLSHPNIVKVSDVSYGDRLQYIVMEYVEGVSLKDYIEQQGKLQSREVIHFTAQILRALQHAHDKGIIHRDVKPQNIMLLSNGTIKVTDFGIARFNAALTKSLNEGAIGTAQYMSPEQVRGEPTDEKTDIYSMGIVLYEMLTGSLPFEGDSSVSIAMMQIQNDPTPPTELDEEIPLGLEQMTLHAMRKNSRERYQSAAEMILDLEEIRRNPAVTFDYAYSVDTAPTKYVTGKQKNTFSQGTQEEKINNRTVPILVGIGGAVLLMAAIAVGIYALVVGFRVTVPDFLGDMYEDINHNDYSFNIQSTEAESDSLDFVTPGQVFRQSPEPGRKVRKNTTVVLSVVTEAQEIKEVTIPNNLIGMTLADAETRLKELGLVVDAHSQPATNNADIGKVMKSEPEPGAKLKTGDNVTIWYAYQGGTVEVPNLVRTEYPMTLDEAEHALQEVNLVLNRDDIKYADSEIEEGRIIEQSPRAGAQHPVGGTVRVTLSTGKAPQSVFNGTVTLPRRPSLNTTFRVYINDVEITRLSKNVTLDGSTQSFSLENTQSARRVVVKVGGWTAYSATVDFTRIPPAVSRESRPSPNNFPSFLPNVVSLSETAGIARLERNGFTNIVVAQRVNVSNRNEDGVILSQTPTGDSESSLASYYSLGTKIELTVGRYVESTTTTTTTTTTSTTSSSATTTAPSTESANNSTDTTEPNTNGGDDE